MLVEGSKNEGIQSKALIRSGVTLLYAHWEGFVKKSSSYYLEYVASHRLKFNELSANFVGLVLKSKFDELGASKKISGGNALADFFCTKLDDRSNVPYKKIIETKSNLSSIVLMDILDALGLDRSPFLLRSNFIDRSLLSSRNYIAHGEDVSMTTRDYIVLHDDVLTLIMTYKNEIDNAAVQNLFKRTLSTK